LYYLYNLLSVKNDNLLSVKNDNLLSVKNDNLLSVKIKKYIDEQEELWHSYDKKAEYFCNLSKYRSIW
jgi:5'(3')-deoxyribonucleotidase